VRYSHAYAPTPLCCPARATILTGQYAHNTGVLDNSSTGTFAGGFTSFNDRRTVATELDDAGVTTGYIGKYLNGYSSRYVPPGWDMWMAGVHGQYRYRDTTRYNRLWSYQGKTVYNVNGTYVTKRGYETHVQTNMATRFIRTHADEQFFLELNWLAPHGNMSRGTARP
jgi:arylsulfatase A-like enzyme